MQAADLTVPFEIDDYTRWRLLEGLDDIGLTLRHADAIDAFEAARPAPAADHHARQKQDPLPGNGYPRWRGR